MKDLLVRRKKREADRLMKEMCSVFGRDSQRHATRVRRRRRRLLMAFRGF